LGTRRNRVGETDFKLINFILFFSFFAVFEMRIETWNMAWSSLPLIEVCRLVLREIGLKLTEISAVFSECVFCLPCWKICVVYLNVYVLRVYSIIDIFIYFVLFYRWTRLIWREQVASQRVVAGLVHFVLLEFLMLVKFEVMPTAKYGPQLDEFISVGATSKLILPCVTSCRYYEWVL
jgi:hypothetical protein